MSLIAHWTSKDLDALPQLEGVRYEIIEGDLYVSTAPSFAHQYACDALVEALRAWSRTTALGVAMSAPGLIFAPDQDVIPDVIWISETRLAHALDATGHFTTAPELIIEVLSPGRANQQRDREVKRDLYSRQPVEEYWIVDPVARIVDVHTRQAGILRHAITRGAQDTLTSPLLPGFSCPVHTLFRAP
jgi:Uma2 family endonuclease